MIYASYFNGSNFAVSKQQNIDAIDRVGSGDAFSAGIVYCTLHKLCAKDTVTFSTASSALKHTIANDINFSTLEEIKTIMRSQSFDVSR